MNPYAIILKPVVTEKVTRLREEIQCACFRVSMTSGKVVIKKAIEEIYGVKVAKVRTVRMRGKLRRLGRYVGRRSGYRKAYITLKKGEKPIEYLE